jgi:hypothetical protein
MTNEELKLKRMEYLTAILNKYTITEPKLGLKDIAEILAMELGDELVPFLQKLKREIKKC